MKYDDDDGNGDEEEEMNDNDMEKYRLPRKQIIWYGD